MYAYLYARIAGKMPTNPRGPLYQHIEFCRNAETLWHKLQSGHWDWLGVHPNGQLILGSPRLGRSLTDSASIKLVPSEGAEEAHHEVRYQEWTGTPNLTPGVELFTDEARAKVRYEQVLEQYRNKNPILAKVQLLERKFLVEEEFIA